VVEHPLRVALGDPLAIEQLARQIQPAAGGILDQIAQNVGQLQRLAER
jgi:hypothetical protein